MTNTYIKIVTFVLYAINPNFYPLLAGVCGLGISFLAIYCFGLLNNSSVLTWNQRPSDSPCRILSNFTLLRFLPQMICLNLECLKVELSQLGISEHSFLFSLTCFLFV
ncbi:unnamed protein product [Brassica oleracea]